MDTTNAAVPFKPFKDGQILYLPTDRQAGLILQYRYFAGFAGVGAAVGFKPDTVCLSVYPIGELHFLAPETPQQRTHIFRQRILYATTLCRITAVRSPVQRAYLIVRQLCQWLNPRDVQQIPYEVMAQLVCLSPDYIQKGWQQYLQHYSATDPRLVSVSKLGGNSASNRRLDVGSVHVPVTLSHLYGST